MLSLTAPNWRPWELASEHHFALELKNPSGLSSLTRGGDKQFSISLCVFVFFCFTEKYGMWHFLKKKREIVLYEYSSVVTHGLSGEGCSCAGEGV